MYEYQVLVTNVVDGDTIDVDIDLGFTIHYAQRIRIYGLNTPERGSAGWAEATAFVRNLLTGQMVTAHTVKPHEKYGRWLASLDYNGQDVAEAIIAAGLGVAYYGGAR